MLIYGLLCHAVLISSTMCHPVHATSVVWYHECNSSVCFWNSMCQPTLIRVNKHSNPWFCIVSNHSMPAYIAKFSCLIIFICRLTVGV